MTTVYLATGTSKRTYHTIEDCYHLQKAERYREKELSHIEMMYDECTVCEKYGQQLAE